MYLKNDNIHILNKYFPNDISNIINSYSHISLLEWDNYIYTYFFKNFNHKYVNTNYFRFDERQKYALQDYAGTGVYIFLNNIDKTYTSKISIEYRDCYILYYLEKHKYADIEEIFEDITKYLNFLNNSNRIQKLFHFYKIPKGNFKNNGKCDIMKIITKNILEYNIINSINDNFINMIKNNTLNKTISCFYIAGALSLCMATISLKKYQPMRAMLMAPVLILDVVLMTTGLMKKIATYL